MLNALLGLFGARLHRASSVDALGREARTATAIVGALTDPWRAGEPGASGIVFSMDRALQLDALLSSYRECVRHPAPLHVLYRATTAEHRDAYASVLAEHAQAIAGAVEQRSRETFRPQLLEILDGVKSEHVFFLVDDNLFTERFDLDDLLRVDTRRAIPSFRHGANLAWSYVVQKPQPLPPLYRWNGSPAAQPEADSRLAQDNRDDLICWRWSDGVHEWAYPLSVDGHLFATTEVRILASQAAFDSPNTFEGSLQEFANLYLPRLGVCYRKSRMVNIPWNKVQSDVANFHGSMHQNDLLRAWQRGMRLDYRAFLGVDNESAHQEFDLVLRARGEA